MSALTKYARYQQLSSSLRETCQWFEHFVRKDWQTHTPGKISAAHSNIKLTIPNQYTSGGTNYWDSPVAFNAALLEVLATTDLGWECLKAAKALQEVRVGEALIAAEEEITQVQEAIASAKEKTNA